MLDLVFVTMFLVVPVMIWGIGQARWRRRFHVHRRIQVSLGVILAIAVLAFEIDLRINGWRHRAEASRFWREGRWNDAIDWSLLVHLAFAIPTLLLWVFVIVQALRHFPRPTYPNSYSAAHRCWGRWAAVELVLTAVTGWIFYVLAFVA